MARQYIPVPDEWLDEMAELSDAEYGRLIRWCQKYITTGAEEKLSGNERFYLKRCRNAIDRFVENWEAAIDQKREAGRKGAAARWNGTAIAEMADDSTAIESIAPPFPPMAPDGGNGYTDTDTKTKTDISLSSVLDRTERREIVEKPVENSGGARKSVKTADIPRSGLMEPQPESRALPRWATVDTDVKEEVSQIAKDLYTAFVPGKQVNPGICISLYTQLCEVDAAGKVYVSSERKENVIEAYQRARQMGKPGNSNVIRFVLQQKEAAI